MCDEFADAVRKWCDLDKQLKHAQASAKAARSEMKALQPSILAYMEQQHLDVCNINRDGNVGTLQVRNRKSTKGVKRERAVEAIVGWMQDERASETDNPSMRADALWERVLQTRETDQKRDLALSHA